MRILIAAIVGGLVAFACGALAHMVLPLGQIDVKEMPDESAVLSAMRTSMEEPGVYLFPWIDMESATEEETEEWERAWAMGPVGMIAYAPAGGEFSFPMLLAKQLGAEVVSALVAAVLVARMRGWVLTRALCVALLGVFAWTSVSVPQWNWYSFPAGFTVATLATLAGTWFLAGIAIACIVPKAE